MTMSQTMRPGPPSRMRYERRPLRRIKWTARRAEMGYQGTTANGQEVEESRKARNEVSAELGRMSRVVDVRGKASWLSVTERAGDRNGAPPMMASRPPSAKAMR